MVMGWGRETLYRTMICCYRQGETPTPCMSMMRENTGRGRGDPTSPTLENGNNDNEFAVVWIKGRARCSRRRASE